MEVEDLAAPNYVPFRLSNNLVEFIGRSGGGLTGLFAGVMTACSLAMGKHHEKLLPLIHLVYRDELPDDREQVAFIIQNSIELLKFKMTSLSQNRTILNLDHFLNDPEYRELLL